MRIRRVFNNDFGAFKPANGEPGFLCVEGLNEYFDMSPDVTKIEVEVKTKEPRNSDEWLHLFVDSEQYLEYEDDHVILPSCLKMVKELFPPNTNIWVTIRELEYK